MVAEFAAVNQQYDVKVTKAELYFLPLKGRVPMKFGADKASVRQGVLPRVCLTVADGGGKTAQGWGETPVAGSWTWPSDTIPLDKREQAMRDFLLKLVPAWAAFPHGGHPIDIGQAFLEEALPQLLEDFNRKERAGRSPMPWLSALVTCSIFDVALHDAYGVLHKMPVFKTYGPPYMTRDLAHYLEPAEDARVSFDGKYPMDYFDPKPPSQLPVWHLVGGVDPLETSDLTGDEPKDGLPLTLRDWIDRDGLNCLKIKLRGNHEAWDYERIVNVGRISIERCVDWLTVDFNCTVQNPDYVNRILDRLLRDEPRIYGMILYVEQPFPYDIKQNRIDGHSVSARKPLFMDESAHDWKYVRLGRSLGWTGVALKTCKTQTGALLSLCWAKAHGMTLMVQDLTNPSRANGKVDLSTLGREGFGYRLESMQRPLPNPVATAG